jgi:hypothetical protein
MLFERGQAEYWIGFVHWKRGELDAASEWLKRYNDSSASLVALDSQRVEWQSELAYGKHNMAAVERERGNLTAARAGFLSELATLQAMASGKTAESLDLRFRIADAHSWLGGIAAQRGEFSEALQQYGAQATQLEALVLAEPKTMRWKFRLADTQLYSVDVLLATGGLLEAEKKLQSARSLLDGVVAHDASNRHWQAGQLRSRLQEVVLVSHRSDRSAAASLIDAVQRDLEQLATAEPSDRLLARWLVSASRLKAQINAPIDLARATTAANNAADLGEKLLLNKSASDADFSECAMALVVAGEIAKKNRNSDLARSQWERAAQILTPRIAESRDWRLLDPAARAALNLTRSQIGRDLVARLDQIGYVPVDPWPHEQP